VSTDIVGIVIATREAVSDLKISIGDSDSPLTNAECSVGVQIEANATSAQVRRGTILETSFTALCHLLVKVAAPRPCFASGWLESYKCTAHLVHARLMLNVPLHGQVCNGKGRYLTLSRLSGASISLCGVEVFPVSANAAISKPATVSGGSNAYLATDGADGVICSFRHPADAGVQSISHSVHFMASSHQPQTVPHLPVQNVMSRHVYSTSRWLRPAAASVNLPTHQPLLLVLKSSKYCMSRRQKGCAAASSAADTTGAWVTVTIQSLSRVSYLQLPHVSRNRAAPRRRPQPTPLAPETW